MAWSKICDTAHAHPKVRATLIREPAAIALHFVALSYVGQYLTDGFVDSSFVQMQEGLMRKKRLADILIEERLWSLHENGYLIHDYLDYNPSKSQVEERRSKDAMRKEQARVRKESAKTPRGIRSLSAERVRTESALPDPTRPDPSPSRKKDSDNSTLSIARNAVGLGREVG